MMRSLKWMALLVMMAAAGGCGDTLTTVDDGGGGGGGEEPITEVASVTLVASPSTIGTNPAAKAIITAIVKDSSNRALAAEAVSFGASSGVLVVTQAITDAAGQAIAALSPGADAANRIANVSAQAGARSATLAISITGSSVNVSGASTAALGVDTPLTITVRDSAGAAVPNVTVTLTSAQSNSLSPSTVITNISGQATVQFQALAGGSHTVNVSALGATANHVVNVSSDVFTVTMAAEISINTCAPVAVNWSTNSVGVNGALTISATRGKLHSDNLCTSAEITTMNVIAGAGTVYVASPNTGPVTVTATTSTSLTASAYSEFVATTPATVVLQASRTTLGLNDSVDLTATVKDVNGNLVKGKTVVFSIVSDVTGGTINPSYDTTDSLGRAGTIYSSTTQSSALDGVTISAAVQGTAISDKVNLTVAGGGVAVSIGMGTQIVLLNSATYSFGGSVQVSNTGGNPVEGQNVTVRLDALSYDKGERLGLGSVATSSVSGRSTLAEFALNGSLNCINEDANRNGELNVGEDINGNTKLDPGFPATVTSPLVTDVNGNAFFSVVYPKDYADWLLVKVTATVQVSGTESSNETRFILPMASSDANTPPGVISPFGSANTCANPL